MGSLDDAIREHLELKRQRGASDEEVKRQEEEAFGRRRPIPGEEEPGLDASAAELAEPGLEAAEPQSNGQPAETAPEALEPAPTDSPAPGETTDAREDLEPEPFEPDEVPAEEALEPEMTVRDAREDSPGWDEPEPGAPDPGDPLEDTPEFLEDTPEEDRLWFEQRPPKDFDLD